MADAILVDESHNEHVAKVQKDLLADVGSKNLLDFVDYPASAQPRLAQYASIEAVDAFKMAFPLALSAQAEAVVPQTLAHLPNNVLIALIISKRMAARARADECGAMQRQIIEKRSQIDFLEGLVSSHRQCYEWTMHQQHQLENYAKRYRNVDISQIPDSAAALIDDDEEPGDSNSDNSGEFSASSNATRIGSSPSEKNVKL